MIIRLPHYFLAVFTVPPCSGFGLGLRLRRRKSLGYSGCHGACYATRPNHIYLVTGFLAEYGDTLRTLGWQEVEVLSPDISAKLVGREKFVRHVTKQLPGWRLAFVGARRMRLLRRMAYLTAQRKYASDGCERGVVLSLT